MNELLARVFSLERHLINRACIPIGVSLMATYRLPRTSRDGPIVD